MSKILWEKTKDGIYLELLPQRQIRGNPAVLRLIAIARMNDVNLIGATFDDTQIVYGRWITILIQEKNVCTFWGVYTSGDSGDITSDAQELPDLCLRKVIWDQLIDVPAFMQAEDKHGYLNNQQSISSEVFFVRSVDIPEFYQLSVEFIRRGEQGISMMPKQRTETTWEEIELSIFGNYGRIETTYLPQFSEAYPLEDLISPWCEQFFIVMENSKPLPAKRITLSYDPSIFELIERIRR